MYSRKERGWERKGGGSYTSSESPWKQAGEQHFPLSVLSENRGCIQSSLGKPNPPHTRHLTSVINCYTFPHSQIYIKTQKRDFPKLKGPCISDNILVFYTYFSPPAVKFKMISIPSVLVLTLCISCIYIIWLSEVKVGIYTLKIRIYKKNGYSVKKIL